MHLLDTIHGLIDRRVLINFQIDQSVLAKVLPVGFRPKLYHGSAIGGVCMIRFKELRPRRVPAWLGLRSENAAHRFAVQWEEDGQTREGVFIPRRDTNSWFNRSFGGRVFPGIFHRSSFDVFESNEHVRVTIREPDGTTAVDFQGAVSDRIPPSSIFPSVEAAAGFFSLGATGYSATRQDGRYHGMELKSLDWSIQPMRTEQVYSRVLHDDAVFPNGSVEFDCALLMRNIKHEWHSRPDLFLAENQRGFMKKRSRQLVNAD